MSIKQSDGFSLLELMAVIVIIGILAAFAIPNFEKSRQGADLMAVQTALSIIQLKTSRCYFNQLENYKDKDGKTKKQCDFDYRNINQDTDLMEFVMQSNYDREKGIYSIEMETSSKNEFELVAKLKTDDNSDCYQLIIDQNGAKTSKRKDGSVTEFCWR